MSLCPATDKNFIHWNTRAVEWTSGRIAQHVGPFLCPECYDSARDEDGVQPGDVQLPRPDGPDDHHLEAPSDGFASAVSEVLGALNNNI